MRLVIDMQGAQSTGSRTRGIGRYTLALIKEIVRQRGDHEVILVLNGAFPDTIEPLKAEFADLLSGDAIRVWFPPTPCRAAEPTHDARRLAGEAILETFIAALRPDFLLVTSLFEGGGDDAITSVKSTVQSTPTAVILYDLIPYIYESIYLTSSGALRWYHGKLGHLRRADLLLSISESSGLEAVNYLNFPRDHVVPIGTACNDEFKKVKLTTKERDHIEETFGLKKPFIMYTGGIDHRKNIEGLIRSYGLLPKKVRNSHQLAIVCSLRDEDRVRLEGISSDAGLSKNDVVFTGFVSDEDLLLLYNLADLFVFPSWHEGFGLPALEAMSCAVPTIGANTSSLPEVLGWDEAMFDPRDDKAIARLMAKALTDQKFREQLSANAKKQAAKFSWKKSAKTAWEALLEAHDENQSEPPALVRSGRKNMAFLSPLPEARSGIADYSAELLPELARHYDIEIIKVQEEPIIDRWVNSTSTIRSLEYFKDNVERYDRILFHFGNSHFHADMFSLLEDYSGVVVLHDFYLSGVAGFLDTRNTPGKWSTSLFADHGWKAVYERHVARGDDEHLDVTYRYPCSGEVFRNAHGGILHSAHGMTMAENWYGEEAVHTWQEIPLLRRPMVAPTSATLNETRKQTREKLGINPTDFVVCTFGRMGHTKQNEALLEAWLHSDFNFDEKCHLVFVGANDETEYGERMAALVDQGKNRIHITGFLDPDTYQRWLLAADIGVQLRSNSRGETSAAVLDCWNVGLPTVVNAHGALAELPDDCVVKLPDEFTSAQLAAALERLRQNKKFRTAIGKNGRSRLLSNHSPRHCANNYASAIEAAYLRAEAGVSGLINNLPSIVPEIGPDDAIVISKAIAETFPPSIRDKQLIVDCTGLEWQQPSTQLEKIEAKFIRHLLLSPPDGFKAEPVILCEADGTYRTARKLGCSILRIPDFWAVDGELQAWKGDRLVLLNSSAKVPSETREQLEVRGVEVVSLAKSLAGLKQPSTSRFDELLQHVTSAS